MAVMKIENNNGLLPIFMRAQNHLLCPECGSKMTESGRACENGTTFIWFSCSEKNCNGQWLQKMPRQQPGYSDFSADIAHAL
jgi:hypothetical protein